MSIGFGAAGGNEKIRSGGANGGGAARASYPSSLGSAAALLLLDADLIGVGILIISYYCSR